MSNIKNDFISSIGNTPLIKLRAASEITGCNIYGKSEYLKGLLKIQLGNSDEGCEYLKVSSEKRYEDSSTGIKASDLFSRFCME